METEPRNPPDDFVETVRDALLHLYDLVYLQHHPLAADVARSESAHIGRGRLLRKLLLDAIETLHPPPGTASTSRAWRLYRILELRYLEGHDVVDAIKHIALSKSQYHREHYRALQAVASLLWEDAQTTGSTPSRPDEVEELITNDNSAWQEVASLRSDAQVDQAARIHPAEVIEGVVDLVKPLCARRRVDLRRVIPDHLPMILGERVALRQALLLILAHAIKSSEQGAVEVVVTGRRHELLVKITVWSPALPSPDRLGITESRPFIEALRGTLTYDSPSEQSPRWTIQVLLPASDRPTLLVVDNNAGFIRLVERYLADYDWEVIGASAIEQASALARQRHPHAILLDVIIPGRDGWDLLTELRMNPETQDIPVIVCSVLDEPDVALTLGATTYLCKPIDQSHLIKVLRPFR